MSEGLYVQFGCGWDAPAGWLNFDASPTLRLERVPFIGRPLSTALKRNPEPFPASVLYGDIVRGLPVGNQSCVGIYCSHVLEHLALDEVRKALRNTKSLLKVGGTFRLVVPDLAYHIRQYGQNTTTGSALEFMRATGLGEESRARGWKGLVQELLGNSRHRWMWDLSSLTSELVNAGFENVRRASIGDSADPMFSRVEREDRWINCLGIECRAR